MHIGKLLVKTEVVDEVWKGSGMINDINFRPWVKDDNWSILTSPASAT